jgi:hypothetical protein
MKILKKIVEYFLIFLFFVFVFNLITMYLIKTKQFSEFSNMQITVGNYYEWGTGGRGGSHARYFFVSNNQKYKSATSFATFKDASPILGRNYIVVYNAKNPKRSGSTMFLNLPVHDSMSHYFRRGSINKIPIESYQRTIDSFYLKNLTGGFGRFFPPYYKKEDFPELQYLR